jgi:DNA invertase Pin-like site-specific DNA recombinase
VKAAQDVIDNADELAVFLSSADAAQVKTWAYVRVSSSKQMRDGMGQEGQVDAIRAYCAANNLDAPMFVVEVSSGGKPLLQVKLPGMDVDDMEDPGRPMLGVLLAALTDKNSAGTTLVFWKLDRLSRIGTEQEMLLRMLAQNDVRVRSTDAMEAMVLDGNNLDPSRLLIRQIMGAFAQYERHLIHMRMQLGIRAKAARGGWVYGTTPYGYIKQARDLVVDKNAAFTVAAICYLRHRGYSFNEIVIQLERRWGIKDFQRSKAHRVTKSIELYRGIYTDLYGAKHQRPDLRIIPDDWEAWGEQYDPVYQAP